MYQALIKNKWLLVTCGVLLLVVALFSASGVGNNPFGSADQAPEANDEEPVIEETAAPPEPETYPDEIDFVSDEDLIDSAEGFDPSPQDDGGVSGTEGFDPSEGIMDDFVE